MFIFRKLKGLERSPQIYDQILFKMMIFAVLHDVEIAKSELDHISHALFVDMKERWILGDPLIDVLHSCLTYS